MTAKRGQTAAIVKSETKPIRKEPMTEAEFWEQLDQQRREIEAAGRPLFDSTWRRRSARGVEVGK